jgi:hypothetical protein
MIIPDNELPPDDSKELGPIPGSELPLDDSEELDPEDQQSQQDIHSNGIDEAPLYEGSADTDILQQSYDASESAYTLKLDEDKPVPRKKK